MSIRNDVVKYQSIPDTVHHVLCVVLCKLFITKKKCKVYTEYKYLSCASVTI